MLLLIRKVRISLWAPSCFFCSLLLPSCAVLSLTRKYVLQENARVSLCYFFSLLACVTDRRQLVLCSIVFSYSTYLFCRLLSCVSQCASAEKEAGLIRPYFWVHLCHQWGYVMGQTEIALKTCIVVSHWVTQKLIILFLVLFVAPAFCDMILFCSNVNK